MTDLINNALNNHFNTIPRPIKLYNKTQNLEDFIINNVVRFCDVCGTRYKRADIVRIRPDQKEKTGQELVQGVELVVITCHNCGKQQALIISMPDKNLTKIDFYLDIPYHKVRQFLKLGPLQSKEIIKLHRYIKSLHSASDFTKDES